jgi:outer membrane immunogenic protein
MRKSLISLAALAAMPVVAASAADMAVKAPPPAPAPYAPYNWTGVYGGVEVGGGWATTQFTVVNTFTSFTPSFPAGFVSNPIDMSGFLGGFYGGYNYQINQFVIGVDGDYTWAALHGTGLDVSSVDGDIGHHNEQINWIATATGRLGYAWDNWLLFAKGGWAWAGFSANSQVVSGTTGAVLSTDYASDDRDGWTVGGGVEWGFSQHVSFKLEYDYVGFETANFNVASSHIVAPVVSGLFARSATSNLNMVKGGLDFRY